MAYPIVRSKQPPCQINEARSLSRDRRHRYGPMDSSANSEAERRAQSGALALLASTALSAAGGLGYWLVAARSLTPEALGWASAIISVLLAASTIAQANGAERLLALLAHHHRPAQLIVRTYGVAAVFSVALAAGGVGLLHRAGTTLTTTQGVIVMVSAAAWSVFTLQDAALTALGRTSWVPFENALYSLAKLALLVIGVTAWGRVTVLVTWVLPVIPLVIAVSFIVRRALRDQPTPRATDAPTSVVNNGLRTSRRGDGTGIVVSRIGLIVLPIAVVAIVGEGPGGIFYVAYSMATALYLALQAMVMPVTSEGVRQPGALGSLVRSARLRGIGLSIAALVVCSVAAPMALSFYGAQYRAAGSASVVWLVAAAIPRAELQTRWAALRVIDRDTSLAWQQSLSGIVMVLGAVIGGQLSGITGASAGVAIGQFGVMALIAITDHDFLSSSLSVVTNHVDVHRSGGLLQGVHDGKEALPDRRQAPSS
jgi:O-antigen/teichoic acid export membrane protein